MWTKMYNIIGDKNIYIQIGNNNNNNTTNNGNSNGNGNSNIVLEEMREQTETPKTIDHRVHAHLFRYWASKPQYLFLFLRSESPYILNSLLIWRRRRIVLSRPIQPTITLPTMLTHHCVVGKVDASNAIDEDDKDEDEDDRTPSIASLSLNR